MKNAIFLFVCFLLFAIGCEKEVVVPPENFTATMTTAPDTTAGPITCALPDGTSMPLPSKGYHSGTVSFLGTLDPVKSTLDIQSCDYNTDFTALKMEIKTVMADQDGDEVYFEGFAYTFFTNKSIANYTITGGTGKFRDAYGWMHAEGTVAQPSLVITSAGQGTIVLPNK